MVDMVVITNATKYNLRAKVEYVVETEEKFVCSNDIRSFAKDDIMDKVKIKVTILEDEGEGGGAR